MKKTAPHPLLFTVILFSVFIIGIFVGRLVPFSADTPSASTGVLDVSAGDTNIPPELDPNVFSSGKLNINSASKEDFALLPGIGEALAERIVAYRQQNGLFSSIIDITHVKGIGADTFSKISQYITVGG